MSSLILHLTAALWVVAAPASDGGAGQVGGEEGGMNLPTTAAAVEAWSDRLFQRLDADADGQLTGAELRVLSRGEVAARGGSRIRALAARSDADNDARITREELRSGAARMFARLDVNGDGELSPEESPRPTPRAAPAIPLPAPEPSFMPGMDEED